MSVTERGSTIDLTTISRAVASMAVGVVHTVERAVVGDARIRTARGNAWEAVCADRDRARQREEIRRLVASLVSEPARPTTESSIPAVPATGTAPAPAATGTPSAGAPAPAAATA